MQAMQKWLLTSYSRLQSKILVPIISLIVIDFHLGYIIAQLSDKNI